MFNIILFCRERLIAYVTRKLNEPAAHPSVHLLAELSYQLAAIGAVAPLQQVMLQPRFIVTRYVY